MQATTGEKYQAHFVHFLFRPGDKKLVMVHMKQWWMRLLPVLLTTLKVNLTFESLPDYPEFEDLQNDSALFGTDYYPFPHYQQIYDHPPFILEQIDNFTNSKTCQEFWSCSKAESNAFKSHNGLCYCDDLCTFFGDCCQDKLITSSINEIKSRLMFGTAALRKHIRNDVERTESKMKSLEEKRLDKNLYKCSYNQHEKDFLYTIIACPKEYIHLEIRQKCELPETSDRLLHVPVSGFLPGLKDGTLPIKFYNLYCALCYSVSYYEFWLPKFDCNSSENTLDIKEFLGKYLDYNRSVEFIEDYFKCKQTSFISPLKVKTRDCLPFDDVCQIQKSEEMNRLCHQEPFHPVFLPNMGNKIYRNIHCAYCNNISLGDLSCNGTSYVHPNFHTYEINGGGLSKLYNFNLLKETCGKNAIYDFFKGSCRPIFSRKSHTCKENDPMEPFPMCQLIKLDENEYKQSGDSIYFQMSDLTINKSLLHFICDKPYICAEYIQHISKSTYLSNKIEVYITIIGLTLSILALLVTFGVYACFRSLRNVPGKMSMNLVASMFLASLLFIFSNDKLVDVICTTVAVCMHYAYLVSFFWMNALSFDAWNTFSKIAIGGRSKHCYKYYLIYCWITPLFIVCISIFAQFTPLGIFPTWLSPKYGPPFCWISNKWALLIFFAAPLFLIILCNIVFYILTIRTIYRTEKISDRMLSKKNKGMFLIYLKLCFIMGINWMFALLHTFTEITIIRYLSVFLNSFQGFWVGCSYIFSKQVWRQLKDKLAFMFRSTEHNDSDLSGSKQTTGTYLSGMKGRNGAEKLMGKA